MANEVFFHRFTCDAFMPTVISEILDLSSGSSAFVVKSTIEERACPNSAEYPPVLNNVPLKSNGENRPLDGRSGKLEK
ncbi:hypothetical protein ES708_22919 [subsurface metagenome]